MACGKKSNNAPTEEFILESPAPVDVAAKLSAIYRELSLKVPRLYRYSITQIHLNFPRLNKSENFRQLQLNFNQVLPTLRQLFRVREQKWESFLYLIIARYSLLKNYFLV